ncbi:hypothetical protein HMPREF1991_02179 [Hoylesella loescheii DSM 19665 = JCM 12249 = ATCC 15930]|uniref:Uncharacterized protein n=1 Tax=Hoylesella loescheii DSM 19665 = JCM 12249 = ATCC 15930 TaxID=1122985 RepID=A0A069QG54_HOYLO|nr:hypothetical protein HMPREF1991_02179 [Hoylesella loescheii DSM 19665 = JCM 12249 = ATCC 15930]
MKHIQKDSQVQLALRVFCVLALTFHQRIMLSWVSGPINL